jgi:hypothetical protein
LSETAAPAAPAGEGGSPIRVLGQALFSPRAAFEAIARRPVFLLALAVLVLLGVAAIGIGFAKVSGEDYIRSLEEAGRPVPPQFSDDPDKMMSVVRTAALGSALLLQPVVYLALAGLFLVAFRLLGSEIDYRRSLSVTLHGLLPMAVAALAGIVIALARDRISIDELQGGGLVMSNLGLLAGDSASKALRALLTSVDLFSAWSIALLGFGYRIVARVSAGAALGTVGVLWLVGILIKVGLAAAF